MPTEQPVDNNSSADRKAPTVTKRFWNYVGRNADNMLRNTLASGYRKKYGLEFRGLEPILEAHARREPLVIVANHVSLDDAPILLSAIPFATAVAMDWDQYRELTDTGVGFRNFSANLVNAVAEASANPDLGLLSQAGAGIGQLFSGLASGISGATTAYRNQIAFWRSNVVAINFKNPEGIRKLKELCIGDEHNPPKPVIIFPSGMLTRDGTLMPVQDGAAAIAEAAGAKIVPINLHNFEHLPSAHAEVKKRGFRTIEKNEPQPRLVITALEPRSLDTPQKLSGKERRQRVSQELAGMLDTAKAASGINDMTIFDTVREAALLHGMDKIIVEDPETYAIEEAEVAEGKFKTSYTYRQLLRDSILIGNKVSGFTECEEHVGMMIANSKGAAAAVLGIQSRGRVPTMLNPKMDLGTMQGCIKTAGLKTVFTSRKLADKLGLLKDKDGAPSYMDSLAETVVDEATGQKLRIVYAEDMRKEFGVSDLFKAARSSFTDPYKVFDSRVKPDSKAMIFFTSGSEGAPKGVVLSHRNILANVAQVSAMVNVVPNDVWFNTLPLFHSYGMNAGMLYPLLRGVRSFQFPDPTNAKQVVSAVNVSAATVMTVTNTFAGFYLDNAKRGELNLVRAMVVGGEALKPDVIKKADKNAPHAVLYQGWGATEGSPVFTLTQPGDPLDTVGRFLPHVGHKLEAVEGYPKMAGWDVGICSVRGPNLMLGYMKIDQPGVLQPLAKDGWYNTGDVVAVQQGTGLVKIIGRAKRIAKIGGEMVPLAGLENDIGNMADLVPAKGTAPEYAVVCVDTPTEKAKLVLYTSNATAQNNELGFRAEVVKRLQAIGTASVALPKEVVYLSVLPKLAIGKVDIRKLETEYPSYAGKEQANVAAVMAGSAPFMPATARSRAVFAAAP